MATEIKKVDPKEFGLEQKEVATIEQAFAPKIAEREGYSVLYEQLITKEISKATCAEARELRLKLVKVRTGIAEIHKSQKAFFLAAGKFVDAWKNKETIPVTQMEDKLGELEKYYENLEAERIAKLATERETEIRKYSEVIPYDLGNMEQSIYDNYLIGVKVAMEARIKAEEEAEKAKQESERIEKLNTERKNKTIRLVEFIDNYENISFGEMSEDDFMKLVNDAIKKRTDHEAEQERIRLENEKLKKEAEEKEKALAKERAEAEVKVKAQRELRIKRNEELKPYLIFIRDYSTMVDLPEYAYLEELAEVKKAAELQWKADAEASQKLKEQQANAAKVAAELQAKKDAEIAAQKAKEDAELKAKQEAELAAKAPRKQKLEKWVDSFSLPEFENDGVADEIKAKFAGFKVLAKKEVEKL